MVLCRGAMADGTPYWAYVKMSPLKGEAMQAARASGQPFQLQDFGEIIRWGKGDQVPRKIKKEMEAEYGGMP